ncbi:MAG TPA: DJ-1/PfpI family protein [Tianweitania sediminis]|nr:DJ-1/PfpI family protein [Tianweitania sediminis]
MSKRLQVGLLVFPNITQLDMTGPLQVFTSVPDTDVYLLWKDLEPVNSDTPLIIKPTMTLAECPQLDVICVPGGYGTDALLLDDEVLDFLRRQGATARYVTSVCTGSIVLAAAGLLGGYRAATHWSAREALALLGVTVSTERVCIDRNRITGGGVTAGIDLGLTVVAELVSPLAAQAAQLRLEYNPAPPFTAGSPDTAPAEVLDLMVGRMAGAKARRLEIVAEAAARMLQPG